MKFFSTSSVLFGIVATAVTAVSAIPALSQARPNPGKYYIVDRVLSPSGDKLALTFNGQGNALTVTPLANAANQAWTLANYDANTQSVAPVSSSGLQIAFGSNGGLTALPARSYVWRINDDGTGYGVQDGAASVNWGLDAATSGGAVVTGKGTDNEKQRWIFTAA